MTYFNKAIEEGKGRKAATFMRLLTAEMLEESEMIPEEFLQFYMKQAAGILYWTATGDTVINMPMPDDFTLVIPRELRSDAKKALPSGTTDNQTLESFDSLYYRIWIWLPR